MHQLNCNLLFLVSFITSLLQLALITNRVQMNAHPASCNLQ
jgi:hypothetical protein